MTRLKAATDKIRSIFEEKNSRRTFINFKKPHQFLFVLFILFLPTQLGRHFWPDFALINGIRIDYLSPTVYLTDILVLGMLLSWGLEKTANDKSRRSPRRSHDLCSASTCHHPRRAFLLITNYKLLILSSLFILNILFAQNKALAFFKFLKLTELFFFWVYLKNNLTIRQFSRLATLLSITVIYLSLIAWGQFLKQESIGGSFWFLGERTFNAQTPGIALVDLGGRLLLRPYGTFSHPNVLGGYLAIVLPLLTVLPYRQTGNFQSKFKNTLSMMAVFLGVTALFISFSRTAWVIGGLAMGTALTISFWQRAKKELFRLLKQAFFVLSLLIIIGYLTWPFIFLRFLSLKTTDAQTLELRQELNKAATKMIEKHPLFGVGLGNFIPYLSQLKKGLAFKELQPAHNIYLLITAETGLVGLGVFLWLVFETYQKLISKSKLLVSKKIPNTKDQTLNNTEIPITKIQKALNLKFKRWNLGLGYYLGQLEIRSIRNFIALTSILLLGLVDHYFYTLQQTQLLAALILSLPYLEKS